MQSSMTTRYIDSYSNKVIMSRYPVISKIAEVVALKIEVLVHLTIETI